MTAGSCSDDILKRRHPSFNLSTTNILSYLSIQVSQIIPDQDVFRQDRHPQHRPQNPVSPQSLLIACNARYMELPLMGIVNWDMVPGRPLLVKLAMASTRP